MTAAAPPPGPLCCPLAALTTTQYDRTPALSQDERAALAFVVAQRAQRPHRGHWPTHIHTALARLLTPVADVMATLGVVGVQRYQTPALLQRVMHERQTAYWAWTGAEWRGIVQTHVRGTDCRQQALACMYLLGGGDDVRVPGVVCQLPRFAAAMLGADAVADATARVRQELHGWGWTGHGAAQVLHRAVSVLLLASRSPRLEGITLPVVQAVLATTPAGTTAAHLQLVARALVGLGILRTLPESAPPPEAWPRRVERLVGMPTTWAAWCARWYDTSTLGLHTRRSAYYLLLKTAAGPRLCRCRLLSPEYPACGGAH